MNLLVSSRRTLRLQRLLPLGCAVLLCTSVPNVQAKDARLPFYEINGLIQQAPYTGRVFDGDSNETIPGVTVNIKGTQNGTVTEIDGSFEIDAQPGETLIIRAMGYTTQEVVLTEETNLDIFLATDSRQLDEVVVVGYGEQKRINLTGAVSTIGANEMRSRPITTIGEALQGQMPGVTVRNTSAQPGQRGNEIRIRGIGTLGDANPLVVIDGVPGGNLNILNPDDVESISVLKDAASSAIYGVRGANGVILVTTKRGKKGDSPTVSYSGYMGMQTPTAVPELLGSPEYMELLNESQLNVGRNPTYTQGDINIARSGEDPNYFANTNWMNEILRSSAPQQNHNVSINGGGENMSYYLSYGNLQEGGLVTGDNYKAERNNVRLRVNTQVIDKLDIDVNLGYVDRSYSGSSFGIGAASGPIYAANQILPLVPVRFTTGGWGYIGGQSNPVAVVTDGGTNDFSSQEFTGNVSARLELFDGFSVRGQYGLISSNSKRNIFTKTVDYFSPDDGSLIYQTNPINRIDSRDYVSTYQTFIATAEYDKTFNDIHDIKILAGASQEEFIGDNFTASRTHLVSQEVGHINLGTENQLNTGNASQNALQSLFGRVNYGLNNKYLAEVNFRYDGSSRFSPDVRWNMFTSASVGWIFSEESFFDNLRNVIESGKIRASYGTQGNDRVGSDFAYLSTYGPVNNTFPIGGNYTIGYRETGVPNSLLTWETMEKMNIGLDFQTLNGRLGIIADYYINNTRDILLVVPLPDVLGTGYPPQNAGMVRNEGWELGVSWRDQIREFRYGVSFNLSDVRNEVVSLGGVPPTFGDQVRLLGHPIDAFYGLVADRIAQPSDFDFNEETGVYTPNFPTIPGDPVQPGDIIYRDLDGDGEISLDTDRTVIGSPIPRYTYGLQLEAGWRGFDISLFIQGVGKANGLINGPGRHALINEGSMPQHIHLDRWTPENPNASYPRLTYQQSYNQRLSTFWLEDASYLRLKNLQIGYTLPSNLLSRLRINSMRVYASGDNLLTRTNFFYAYDPETPVSSGGFYPQVKTFILGVNFNLK
ncbi:TonB-dependent receptor [Litoribacter alkaliphilus]|uniref:TonB-dependent receptor n=1 Tax=Litoribacter ruber TaxID=702568 RepID=A0AAP2CJ67_9BACT|nr:TonB-dependent receptor [Litoribacter alkaliphilus]MBS9525708.1 TonB-dependent receptor [Litoribacter alkaliphilus]